MWSNFRKACSREDAEAEVRAATLCRNCWPDEARGVLGAPTVAAFSSAQL